MLDRNVAFDRIVVSDELAPVILEASQDSFDGAMFKFDNYGLIVAPYRTVM